MDIVVILLDWLDVLPLWTIAVENPMIVSLRRSHCNGLKKQWSKADESLLEISCISFSLVVFAHRLHGIRLTRFSILR